MTKVDATESAGILDFLESLDVVDAGDLADSIDDSLKVFEVGDFQDYVYIGLSVFATG